MKRKVLGYIGVIGIGIGFIMMAASNIFHSELASALQAVCGALFIVAALKMIISEYREK